MIYQIVNADTGLIHKTVTAPTLEIARMYLEDGQLLYEGGLLAFERKRLMVQNNTIVQIPYVGPNVEAELLGDGLVLRDVTVSNSLVPVITQVTNAESD